MLKLNVTDSGIYYLHDYIPVKQFSDYPEKKVAISKMIWAYKDGDEQAFDVFTKELMWAVATVANSIESKNIGLVAVPPSKVYKMSAVRNSILEMVNWYNQGIIRNDFGCSKVFYDYSNLLKRVFDISTAHKGARATYAEQKKSICCNRNKLSRYRTTFIILDDVTTTGTSMDVCGDILLEHGAEKQCIIRMAIARTV